MKKMNILMSFICVVSVIVGYGDAFARGNGKMVSRHAQRSANQGLVVCPLDNLIVGPGDGLVVRPADNLGNPAPSRK